MSNGTPEKPAYKSMTIVGVVVIAIIGALEKEGLIPDGVGQSIATLLQALGVIGVGVGVRRAIKPDVLQPRT